MFLRNSEEWKSFKWTEKHTSSACATSTVYGGRSSLRQENQFISVPQLCLTLCDPTNCSTPGLPVHHQLPEFTQIHVHQVGDAIQTSYPLSSSSPPAPNLFPASGSFQLSQLFAPGGQSIGGSASATSNNI